MLCLGWESRQGLVVRVAARDGGHGPHPIVRFHPAELRVQVAPPLALVGVPPSLTGARLYRRGSTSDLRGPDGDGLRAAPCKDYDAWRRVYDSVADMQTCRRLAG